MKNIIILLLSVITLTPAFAQRTTTHKVDHYKRITGKWEGTGFMTDAYGNRQDVNATQWVSIKIVDGAKVVIINGIFENPINSYKANFLKEFYYNTKQGGWRIKVYVENKYYVTTKLSLSDNYTLIYTFKDEQDLMNRATIYAANPYGWTEMLETWNGGSWDIKRRIFMRKIENIVKKSSNTPPY